MPVYDFDEAVESFWDWMKDDPARCQDFPDNWLAFTKKTWIHAAPVGTASATGPSSYYTSWLGDNWSRMSKEVQNFALFLSFYQYVRRWGSIDAGSRASRAYLKSLPFTTVKYEGVTCKYPDPRQDTKLGEQSVFTIDSTIGPKLWSPMWYKINQIGDPSYSLLSYAPISGAWKDLDSDDWYLLDQCMKDMFKLLRKRRHKLLGIKPKKRKITNKLHTDRLNMAMHYQEENLELAADMRKLRESLELVLANAEKGLLATNELEAFIDTACSVIDDGRGIRNSYIMLSRETAEESAKAVENALMGLHPIKGTK